jgi:uncharacterized membrane protein YphA (DoxX/SURF4 family)
MTPAVVELKRSLVMAVYLHPLALLAFLIPATIFSHAIPMLDSPHLRQQMGHVLKDLAIEGGLLKLMADGTGAFSLDSVRTQTATAQGQAGSPLLTSC